MLYTKTSKVYIGLYIFCIFGAAMGDYKVLNAALGALPKLLSAGAIGLALIYFFWTGNIRNFKILYRFGLLYSSVIIGIILVSIFIWIIQLESIGFIIKGTSKISYQLLNIAIVLSAVYMFEEKAAVYTFYGIAGANLVIILIGAATTGIGSAINDMIRNITTFGANDVIINSSFIRAIEIHDITFVMGVYVIYFLFFCPQERLRFLYAGVALFLFFAGLKRIAFLSLLLGIAFAIICLLLSYNKKIKVLYFTAFFIVAFCYFYIIIIQNGTFMKFEFCVQLLKSMHGTKDQVVDITAVHNDILKMYVEVGFWGFFAWIMFYYVYQTHWYITRCGEMVAVCFMSINIYMLITYLTDNTMFYYWSSMVVRLLPMSYFFVPEKLTPLRSENPLYLNSFDRWRLKRRQKDAKLRKKPKMILEK